MRQFPVPFHLFPKPETSPPFAARRSPLQRPVAPGKKSSKVPGLSRRSVPSAPGGIRRVSGTAAALAKSGRLASWVSWVGVVSLVRVFVCGLDRAGSGWFGGSTSFWRVRTCGEH